MFIGGAQLGVQLVYSTNGCVIVHIGSKSHLLVDVKAKKYFYCTITELKVVVIKKSIDTLTHDGKI